MAAFFALPSIYSNQNSAMSELRVQEHSRSPRPDDAWQQGSLNGLFITSDSRIEHIEVQRSEKTCVGSSVPIAAAAAAEANPATLI